MVSNPLSLFLHFFYARGLMMSLIHFRARRLSIFIFFSQTRLSYRLIVRNSFLQTLLCLFTDLFLFEKSMFSTRRYAISRPVYGYVLTLITLVLSGPSTTHLHTIYADKFLLIGANYLVAIFMPAVYAHTQCTDLYIHTISREYSAFKSILNFKT